MEFETYLGQASAPGQCERPSELRICEGSAFLIDIAEDEILSWADMRKLFFEPMGDGATYQVCLPQGWHFASTDPRLAALATPERRRRMFEGLRRQRVGQRQPA